MTGDRRIANSAGQVASLGSDCARQAIRLDEKTYFEVPFEQNLTAKAAGLQWDNAVRKWYAANLEVAKAFSLFVETEADSDASAKPNRHYFKVPFLQKDRAKAMGMRFDGIRKLWFAPDASLALDVAKIFESLVD